jgi:predicted nucleic acid-binding protein
MTAAAEVVVDTSVWIDHFRHGSPRLVDLLAQDRVLIHPYVLLELACGTPPAPRERTLSDLARLRPAQTARTEEVLAFIERELLFGQGCGMTDLSLLAATHLTPGARLWTLDKPLAALAARLGVAWNDQDP